MTFLGGYLGAGKTTIVNEVLRQADRRIAVLVNDVGAVAVDASLVASMHDDTIELTNGCVCCSLVDGFAVALESLRQRATPPEHVLVELSGVAEPARVRPWASTAGFVLDGIVVVADADGLVERAEDPRVGDLVRAQLGAADLVLVSKLDLVDDRSPTDQLLASVSGAPTIDVEHGEVSAGVLLGPKEHVGRSDIAGSTTHVVDVVDPGPATRAALDEALADLPIDVVRAKGVVMSPTGPRLVQRVGRRVSVTAAPPDATPGLVVVALSEAALSAAVARLSA